jgi:DNA polymerase
MGIKEDCVGGIRFYYTPPMVIDGPAKYRLLLSLRSESVMGLRSIHGGVNQLPDQQVDEAQASAPATSEVELPLTAEVDLFATASARTPVKVVSSIELPLMSTSQKTAALSAMNENEVSGCRKCRLCLTRTRTVFGEGDVNAKIFFIGEGPGENEDLTGRPFVGRAGQLLDKMIGAMGLSRPQVFIANIVKCRPPDNRLPAPDEVETCTPYLVRQLEIVRPKVIVTLGLPAVKYMLGDPKLTMGRTRGTWQSWRGIKLMPTYHPSYVLRAYTEANRQAVWSDLQMVMKEVGLKTKSG